MSATLTPPPQPNPPQPRPLAEAPKLYADGTVAKPWYKRDFYVGRPVKIEEVMNFSRQLSSFLRAGVPILDSLAVVAEENASKKMQEVVRRRAAPAARRAPASATRSPSTRRSSPATTSPSCEPPSSPASSTTRSSSSPGTSSARSRPRRELKSALTYPIIVFFLAIVAMVIMAAFVLPKFRTFYTSLGANLPLPTRMLLGFTNLMTNWWWLIVAHRGRRVGARRLRGARRQAGQGRGATRSLLRLPAIGQLMQPHRDRAVLPGARHARAHRRAAARRGAGLGRQHEQPRVPGASSRRSARR